MDWNLILFGIFPYAALTSFVVGHFYRYATDAVHWNARSSELFSKKSLAAGSWLFHWGMIFVLIGHGGGLLIPQRVYDAVGIGAAAHMRIAYWLGIPIGIASVAGILLLSCRRLLARRVAAQTSLNDAATLALLFLVIGVGTYNVFTHTMVLYTVAPWLRSILLVHPEPELMRSVPVLFKVHVLSAFALFGFWPYSRLVHALSPPLTYPLRSYVILRRRGPA
jgi:nitrate reductase gamma subunit